METESLRGGQVRQDAAGLGRKEITALFRALWVTELTVPSFHPARGLDGGLAMQRGRGCRERWETAGRNVGVGWGGRKAREAAVWE